MSHIIANSSNDYIHKEGLELNVIFIKTIFFMCLLIGTMDRIYVFSNCWNMLHIVG
jgi:hypothetical protein